MAKVSSKIPTSKPIFDPHTKQNKTPESAPATGALPKAQISEKTQIFCVFSTQNV